MLGLEHQTAQGTAQFQLPTAPGVRVRGPHVAEAKIYLSRIRLGLLCFYAASLMALLLWLPILALITAATSMCGSLLLQSDPLLEPFMRPVVVQLGECVLTLPEYVRFPVKDGLLYLTPLTISCCLGCLASCLELFFAIPSHSTGLGGTIRPLVVLMCGCLHATIFACCWHCRSLIWRPHGSVAYADLYEAAMDLGHPEEEDVKLPMPLPAAAAPAPKAPNIFEAPKVPKVEVELAQSGPEPQVTRVDPPSQEPGPPEADASMASGDPADAPEVNDAPVAQAVEDIELLLRLPSGRRVRCHFLSTDLISQIYDAVEGESSSEPAIRNGSPYCLVTIHPKQAFQDKELTLAEAGLQSSTVLNVEMR